MTRYDSIVRLTSSEHHAHPIRFDGRDSVHQQVGVGEAAENNKMDALRALDPGRSIPSPSVGSVPREATGTPAARIYQRSRSPMQAGRARESIWYLTFEPLYRTEIDFLMGWTGSRDPFQQVELCFCALDEAIAFAQQRGLDFTVEPPRRRRVQLKSYAANFDHDRYARWTH